jgi:hypothetical protein
MSERAFFVFRLPAWAALPDGCALKPLASLIYPNRDRRQSGSLLLAGAHVHTGRATPFASPSRRAARSEQTKQVSAKNNADLLRQHTKKQTTNRICREVRSNT